jgi:hypothetical protein
MKIALDLEVAGVRLDRPDDVESLSVVIEAPSDATHARDAHRLGDVIERLDAGVLRHDGTVSVNIEMVRFLAAGQVDEGWDDRLVALMASARGRGELDDKGRLVIPVIWPSSAK